MPDLTPNEMPDLIGRVVHFSDATVYIETDDWQQADGALLTPNDEVIPMTVLAEEAVVSGIAFGGEKLL